MPLHKRNLIATGIITASVIATTSALPLTAFGCTPTVRPLNPDNLQIEKAEEALVFGWIHLMRNGKDQHTGLRYPIDVESWISEEARGMRFLVDDLPIEGPYILRLPIGRYRITALSADDALGDGTATVRPHSQSGPGVHIWEYGDSRCKQESFPEKCLGR